MNCRPLCTLCCLLTLAVLPPLHAATAAVAPSLIPLPAQMTIASGEFRVDTATPIVFTGHDVASARTAHWLGAQVLRTRGLQLAIKQGSAAHGAIVLQLDPHAPVDHREGYALDVDADGIRVSARDEAGLFYGAVTVYQLLTPNAQRGAVNVKAVHIRDQPRFAWRGLMLDSVRHFQSVAEVETLLNQMAQHKLNTFHWHLTDDQGWRIEIKRYPELTRIGAWRTPPDAGHAGEPLRYGGFYTQQQIRQVVAYAAARYITIVPELDMPGHAQAAVAAYPQLGVTGKRPKVSIDWGVNPYLYNVDDATFSFIDNVLDEVLAIFPSKYIHVGGDEAIKDQWQASPAVQAKMHALGLNNEDALQGWFIGRIGDYLEKHGRRLIGWDEILEGGNVPADATVMSWRGTKGAITAAKAGHDVVLAPSPELYFNQLQSANPDEVAGRMPVQDLASVYAFEPISNELDAAQAKHVLGAQANLWTESITSMAQVEYAVFPRLDALSEVDWSPASARNWDSFVARLTAQLARYRAQKIGYADSAFATQIELDRNAALRDGFAKVTLNDQVNAGAVHYTLDGSAPNLQSRLYNEPFIVNLPVTISAASFSADGRALAAPRKRVLDHAHLLTVSGDAMPNCPGSDYRIRVLPMPDATSMAPAYTINVFNSCQLYPATTLDGVAAIHVEAVRLERNYALAHEQKLVVSHPHSTPFGELVVHLDTCDGPSLASMTLPDPAHSARRFKLDAAISAQHGEHALCLIYTAPIDGPVYALSWVRLAPEAKNP
ncbi:MAG: family 20 glycosylhydrolase [Rhodanobacter sp.]